MNCSREPGLPPGREQADLPYAIRYLDWIIKTDMKKYDIKGLAAAVVDTNGILYEQAYGYADVKRKLPVEQTTCFRAGSISKTLTALAVMKLKRENKLQLDVPVEKYLPGFSIKQHAGDPVPITLRHLLSQKSGIFMNYYQGIMGAHIQNDDEYLAVLKDEYLCSLPGKSFRYSNTGYTLLGMVVAAVSGMPYTRYMQEEILAPLGMEQSSFELTPAIRDNLSKGYVKESFQLIPLPGQKQKIKEAAHLEIRDKPAGSLYSNTHDMAQYIQYLLADKDKHPAGLITNSDFAEMCAIQFPEADEYSLFYFDYGLGFMRNVFGYEGVDDIISHDGDINGFAADLAVSPGQGLGIILLTNTDSGTFARYDIISRAFRHFIAARQNRTVARLPRPARASYTPVPGSLEPLVGRYATIGLYLDIAKQGKGLAARLSAAAGTFKLVPIAENLFYPAFDIIGFPLDIAPFMSFGNVYLSFSESKEGSRWLHFRGYQGETRLQLNLQKINPPAIPAAFDRYLGDWEILFDDKSREVLEIYLPAKNYKLVKDKGWLVLKSVKLPVELSLLLVPVNDQEAVVAGSNETVFFKDDKMFFSGFQVDRPGKSR